MKRYPWNNEKIRVLFLDAHTYDELSTSAKKLYGEYLEKKEIDESISFFSKYSSYSFFADVLSSTYVCAFKNNSRIFSLFQGYRFMAFLLYILLVNF